MSAFVCFKGTNYVSLFSQKNQVCTLLPCCRNQPILDERVSVNLISDLFTNQSVSECKCVCEATVIALPLSCSALYSVFRLSIRCKVMHLCP